jgi:hypothetical protein
MAILVNDLYLAVSDRIAKDQAGNFTNSEFNRILAQCQEDALDYFESLDGSAQFVQNALVPFLKRYEVAVANTVTYPADYRSKRNARIRLAFMNNGEPDFKWFPMNMLETDEDFDALYSPIRKPSVSTEVYSYSMDSTGIRIYPEGITGLFQMSYIKQPAAAVRGVTVDLVNEVEVYDAGTTTNLEWEVTQFNLFHDLICFYMGIDIRESEVMAWLSQRKLKKEPQ